MSNPLGRKFHQKTLDKKYLKRIASDPTQSKLVFHDVMYKGQHHRQLGSTGYNPVFNPAPQVVNYGPVFGSNISITAPMLFGGDFVSNSNNSTTVNRGQTAPLVSNAKDHLSNRQSKRAEREENVEKMSAMIGATSSNLVEDDEVQLLVNAISTKKEPDTSNKQYVTDEKVLFLKAQYDLHSKGVSDYQAAKFIHDFGGALAPSINTLQNWLKEDRDLTKGLKKIDGREVNHEFEKQVISCTL